MFRVLRGFALLTFPFLVLIATAAPVLPLPPRTANAPTGAQFATQVADLDLDAREARVFSEVTSGNVPEFLRKLTPVTIARTQASDTDTATIYVTPDYLAVGSDEDYLLMPASPNLAQRLADRLDCCLPTRKMVDAIYRAADVRLVPSPIPPSAAMTTIAVFSNHNAIVHAQRSIELPLHPLGRLVAGHKKDLVITPKLASAPGKVAIYGWHQTNGTPIQPLYLGHTASWVDYSQCTRLVSRTLLLNDAPRQLAEVLTNADRCSLLSDEGPVLEPRYPTNSIASPTPESPPAGLRRTVSTNLSQADFRKSPAFGEQVAVFHPTPEVTITINAPGDCFFSSQPALLIFYALPNGNTTAQTIGKKLQPGDDWHFDIQHIGAQARFLRQRLTNTTTVVAYLENDLKSWPAWRKKLGDASIPELLAPVCGLFKDRRLQVVLSGHSGGGSLIFGYLNAVEEVPEQVCRIAFLDSSYAYDSKVGHCQKMVKWLNNPAAPRFCILAYDDAAALLNGKTFVSATGGTWGKSHEMQHDLAKHFAFTAVTNAGFERYSALDGRLQLLLKENPDRKILHTVQVERNGFIHAILCGTSLEGKGYEYFGPRAYEDWIASD